MNLLDELSWQDLTDEHRRILKSSASAYGVSVHSSEDARLKAAEDLVAAELITCDGRGGHGDRHLFYHATLMGRVFLRKYAEEKKGDG